MNSNATSSSRLLWKEFSLLTGKVLDAQFASNESPAGDVGSHYLTDEDGMGGGTFYSDDKIGTSEVNLYRQYYFRNPNVPIDFRTIGEALKHCPRLRSDDVSLLSDETTFYSGIGTVVRY